MEIIKNKKIGFTCGTFDLFHSGHVEMLREAKSVCDYLIVGLQIDPSIDRPNKNKPIQNIVERHLQLNSCKFIDEIICYNSELDLLQILNLIPIDIRIIGSDYLNKNFTGKELKIPVYYNNRNHQFSSSELRNRVKNE